MSTETTKKEGENGKPMTPIEFKVRAMLNERSMSIRAFCKAVAINTNTLYEIFERGYGKMPTLKKMAHVLSIDESELLLPSVVYTHREEIRDNQDKSINGIIPVHEAIPLKFVDETEVATGKNGMEFRELDNGMVLMTMTLVPEFAYASYPHGWRDPEYLVELPKYSIVLPKREQGLFRAFEVRGDSMDDGSKYSISHGDVAVGRLVIPDSWDQKLYNNGGTDYIIVTHDGVILKRVIGHDTKEGTITCASQNPNKAEFPNFQIQLSEVFELYKIRKIDRDWNYR